MMSRLLSLRRSRPLLLIGPLLLVGVALITMAGCTPKEKLLDVETPGGEVEVERDPQTGNVDVEVNE
jgi:hypothetical protein